MASPARAPGRPSRRSQPLREFRQRGNPQPDGHQFDRQRQPARLTADAARQRQLSRSRLKRHPRHRGPGQEQRHRLRHHRRADLAGNSHRRHPPHAFGLDVKRDTARHQKPQTRGPPRQLAASTTYRFQHVLAVIDHQQRPAARHRTGNSIKSRRRLGPPDPHPLNQGGNHLVLGATRHQVDIARQLRPARRHLDPGRLNRHSGLPHPADADQRHHRITSQPGRDLPELRSSPDKRRPPRRQPHRRPVPAVITTTAGALAEDLHHQPTLSP